MIKKCKVIINNSSVTVVLYDNIEIQFPSIEEKKDFIFVKKVNDLYTIVSEEEFKKSTVKVEKRDFKKETSENDEK